MATCDSLIGRPAGQRPRPKARADPPKPSLAMPRRIAVLGGGVEGLTVALELMRAFDAARVRRGGRGEPEITVLGRPPGRASGLFASSSVSAVEVLGHLPLDTPDDLSRSTVRVRPCAKDAAIDRFVPHALALGRPGKRRGFQASRLSSNVPHNLSSAVDRMLDGGADARHLATSLDFYVTYMHKDVGSRARDDCAAVAALADTRGPFGRLQATLASACGGGGATAQARLHAAGFAGVLWPVEHAVDAGRLPTDDQPGMWRCGDLTRDVVGPLTGLVRSMGATVVDRPVDRVAAHPDRVEVVVDGTTEAYDLVVDADVPWTDRSVGWLWLPPFLAAEYRRCAGAGAGAAVADTVMFPETPWRLVTCLSSTDELECVIGAADAAGVRGRTFRAVTTDEAAVEIVLQLGFSLADAASVRWVDAPGRAGPDEPVRSVSGAVIPRELLAFEVGVPPVVVRPSERERGPALVGRLVRCRPATGSRQGGAGTLGPSFEAAKMSVQALAHALALEDRMRAATAGPGAPTIETLVTVPGLSATHQLLPQVSGGQRWALFNHLAQRLRVGYRLYVIQAVGATLVVLALVLLAVVVPVVTVKRARQRRSPAPPTRLTVTTG